MKKMILGLTLLVSASVLSANVDGEPKLTTKEAQTKMKASMSLLDNELKQRIGKLSDSTKGTLVQIYRHHDRHSMQSTLRQVMQEVGQEYETMVSAVFMNNPEMAADAARRIANHRIPRGGLIAYLELDQITDDLLGGLDSMNTAVEGNAIKFAQAAEKGDMAGAAALLSPIANGCVACHVIFRGKPGTNSHIK